MIKEISLEKELNKISTTQTEKVEENLITNEVKLLLDQNSSADLRILKDLGLDANIVRYEDQKSKILDLEEKNKKFQGNVFHISAIQQLAVEYKLRFLPSHLYAGNVSSELPAKIREFCTRENINIEGRWGSTERFFILAPQESFKLEARPKDPLMFYKIDETHYRLIHKWGNDFSPLRLIKAFPYTSANALFFHRMFVTFLIILSGLTILSSSTFAFIYNVGISLIVSFIFQIIYFGSQEIQDDHSILTKNNFRSKFKD